MVEFLAPSLLLRTANQSVRGVEVFMHNAMWSAVAGSVFQMRRLDVIANNLANVNTTGFRGDRIMFDSYLAQIDDERFASNRKNVGNISDYMYTATNFQQGELHQTNNPLDVALATEGYFVVQTDKGTMYTRAGNFQFDLEGQLMTGNGFPVQGEGGAIQVRDGLPFEIDEQGSVYQEGEEVGRLQVVQIQNPETMEKVGGKMFKATRATRIAASDDHRVVQGALEGSNVNIVREMGQMVTAGRAFESYQQIISMMDNVNQQANNRLWQVS